MNAMDPGPATNLPALTQMEEMLIAPVHALVSLYQVRGGQFKYSGHCCNFPRDNAVFHNKVPLLPEECDVFIMRRTGVDTATDAAIYQDFRVRRNVIEQWLRYLQDHHPNFRSRRVTVDYERLNQLPEDELIHDRLRTVQSQDLPEPDGDAGPLEEGPNQNQEEPPALFTHGFVPNMNPGQAEFEQLHAAAFHDDTPVILTMPMVHGTPLNEHAGHPIAIDAFPSLFPTGRADFTAVRETEVAMAEWAAHLMRYEDGRRAKHPRFRYWALNKIMRHEAKGHQSGTQPRIPQTRS
ncbi:hypothetical protein B0H13DRAFT_1873234 [Mycena leptocephala]|nr:hypothetical protein B0H13DRAFT_1873234 [Mycena leptocephala]